MKSKQYLLFGALMLLVHLCAVPDAQAELLFYEGFDYSADQTLHSLGVFGVGGGGPWENIRSPQHHKALITEGSLRAGDLQVNGNHATTSNTTSHLYRPLKTKITGTAGDEIWVSYIMQDNSIGIEGSWYGFGLINSGYGFSGNGKGFADRIVSVNAAELDDENAFFLSKHYENNSWKNAATHRGIGTVPYTNGSHLILIKVAYSQNSTNIYAWIDPQDYQLPGDPDMFLEGDNNGFVGFDGLLWYVEPFHQDRSAHIDEIRVGTTIGDVLPTGNSTSGDYLPLSGGTMSNNQSHINMNSSDIVDAHIVEAEQFIGDGSQLTNVTAQVGANDITNDKIANGAVTADKISGGSGSNVDADKLDGMHAQEIIDAARNASGAQGAQVGTPVFMEVRDENDNSIDGSVSYSGYENLIEVSSAKHKIFRPVDEVTGRLTGARQHKEFEVIKNTDRSTPYFFDALKKSKTFNSVTLQFVKKDGNGNFNTWYTVTLNAVRVIEVSTIKASIYSQDDNDIPLSERVLFRYQGINWFIHDGNISVQDTWSNIR